MKAAWGSFGLSSWRHVPEAFRNGSMSGQELLASVGMLVCLVGVMAIWAHSTSVIGTETSGDWSLSDFCGGSDAAADGNALPEMTNSVGMTLRLIPAGRFRMGDAFGEDVQSADEPCHPVRVTRPFYLAAHEVTVGQFTQFTDETGYVCQHEGRRRLGYNSEKQLLEEGDYSWRKPGYGQDAAHPVVFVTWNDAQAFCRWLSEREQAVYRVPTEAQWEYACRAGSASRYSCGRCDDVLREVANVCRDCTPDDGQTRRFSQAVGSYPANAFGLFDMHGNVWEWCSDRYADDAYRQSTRDDPCGPAEGETRVIRGGSFMLSPWFARSANRDNERPENSFLDVGFRVMREF